jgi:hypothetical protein
VSDEVVTAEQQPPETWWSRPWLWYAAALLGLVYLLALALNLLPSGRFGIPEAIIFVAILLLSPGLISRLESLSIESGKFQIKLREAVREQIGEELRPVTNEQMQQRNMLEELRFLITAFLPYVEFEYLTNLAKGTDYWFNAAATADFRGSLRNLRDRNLIAHTEPRVPIANLPESGRLSQYFVITDRGRLYLEIRQRVEASTPEPARQS